MSARPRKLSSSNRRLSEPITSGIAPVLLPTVTVASAIASVSVADKLGVRLKARFPGLNVVGTCTPPFRPLTACEGKQLIAFVEHTKPDVFWVGLGSPKQERFMAQYCGKLDCRLMVGVGAAFNFHSGAVKEAPRWLRNTGLQWISTPRNDDRSET